MYRPFDISVKNGERKNRVRGRARKDKRKGEQGENNEMEGGE